MNKAPHYIDISSLSGDCSMVRPNTYFFDKVRNLLISKAGGACPAVMQGRKEAGGGRVFNLTMSRAWQEKKGTRLVPIRYADINAQVGSKGNLGVLLADEEVAVSASAKQLADMSEKLTGLEARVKRDSFYIKELRNRIEYLEKENRILRETISG